MQYGWDLVLRGVESHAAQIVEIKFLDSRLELSSEKTKDLTAKKQNRGDAVPD